MAGQRVYYQPQTTGYVATSGNTELARILPEPIYEGLVVDRILDHKHYDCAPDAYNVGTIKVRLFSVDHGASDDNLPWIDPIDSTIQEIPAIGEVVVVEKILGNMYYRRKVPLARKLQENAMVNTNSAFTGGTLSSAVGTNEEITLEKHKFGDYFKPDPTIRPLKHFEGDLLIQGRMGQSIRFGSSAVDPSSKELAPSIIIRTGQGKDNENTYVTHISPFGLTLEDINKDASSIWMTSNQTLPFAPATLETGCIGRTLSTPPQIFDKAQILVNSDRVILNAKKENILLYAKDTIYFNAGNEIRIDTDNNFEIATKEGLSFRTSGVLRARSDNNLILNTAEDLLTMSVKKTSILAEKIYIGSTDDEEEPMVGGQSLAKWLRDLINAHLNPKFHVQTPTGPGILHPQVRKNLMKMKERLNGMKDAEFNSEDIFVMLKNEEVNVEKNEFTAGQG